MNETKFGTLESLVGRTFEKAGLKRLVVSVKGQGGACGDHVVWVRPRVAGVDHWSPVANFVKWLSGAKEVKP